MSISVEISKVEGHEGSALACVWSASGTHVGPKPAGPVRFRVVLEPAAACDAADVLLCIVREQRDPVLVPVVQATGQVVTIEAPRAFWLELARGLEITAARIGADAPHTRQRIDLLDSGEVTRAAAMPNGWQLVHTGA